MEMPFVLRDAEGNLPPYRGTVIADDRAVSFHLEGYGDGFVGLVEILDGTPRVALWGNRRSTQPTDRIPMTKAAATGDLPMPKGTVLHFALRDVAALKDACLTEGYVEGDGRVLTVSLKGYGAGLPILELNRHANELCAEVWADAAQAEPTDVICLEGAALSL